MRAKTTSSGRIYYYFDCGYDASGKRHWVPLGSDYRAAVVKWAELSGETQHRVVTLKHAVDAYLKSQEFKEKAPRTQADYTAYAQELLDFFDDPPAPLAAIEPQHVQQYHERRSKSAPVRANRELAFFSVVWNFARRFGYTDRPNPKSGVRRNTERGRDIYIEDDVWRRLLDAADPVTRDALMLAYLLGQRPADVFKLTIDDITDAAVLVKQNKTRARLSVERTAELNVVLASCLARRTKSSPPQLLVNERGTAFTYSAFDNRWDRLREKLGIDARSVQFRDLRAKAGTDVKNARGYEDAQSLLGHTDVKTTQIYTRKRRGDKVKPTR